MSDSISTFMKRLLYLAVVLWMAATDTKATNVVLNSSYGGGASYSEDTVTFNVTINSASNTLPTPTNLNPPQAVAPGVYHFHFGIFGDPEITVNGDGTINNDVFFGLPATFSNNGLSITFSWTYANNVWEFRDSYDDYIPNYAPHDFSQPSFEFLNDTQSWTFYVEGPLPPPPATPKLVWTEPVTVQDYFYHDWVVYGPGWKYFITEAPRTAQNNVRNFTVQLPPGQGSSPPPDKSPLPCNGGCSTCASNPKMAGYSFDSLRGSLRVTDTPLLYTPPVGSGMAFTVSYNQGNVGQEPLPFLSNLGNQFTYSYLSYISNSPSSGNVTRFVPGGGLEYYPNFNIASDYPDLASSADAVSDPERSTRAVLHWDATNQRYTRVLPDGSSQIYDHASADLNSVQIFLITSETDPQGNTITYGYDSISRLVTITDALGQVTTLSYGNGDQYKITKVTDPFGRSAKFQYDSQGRLTSSTDALGIVSNYGYDSTNFLDKLTTPYGTTTFTTDSDTFHHGVNATNPLGQTERVEVRYNSVSAISDTDTVPSATGIQSSASGLSGNNSYYWTRRQYSTAPDYTKATIIHWMMGPHGLTNVVDSQKTPLEGRVWYNYQGQSQADYIADEESASTTITARRLDGGATQASYATYTSTGLITQSIDPLGRTTNYNYDPTNGIDLLTVTQANAAATGGQDLLSTMTYNSQHEPLTVTDASGQTSTMTYNAAGQLLTRTAVVNSANQTTTLAYDGSGYLTGVTGPVSGATTGYTYDSYGRVQTVTDSEGYVITNAYDAADRPTVTTYPDGTTDQTIYKNLDVAKTIDRQGRAAYNYYDAIRELIQTTDSLGRTTKYTWCTCGGLSTLTDANGHVTTWNLDIMGRVTGKVYADASAIGYTYETNTSRLHQMTDARGNVAVYSYNVDNTLSGTAYTPASGVSSTPNVSFTYDTPYNRVLTMADGTGTTTYSYHPINAALGAGRLASVSVPIAGSPAIIAYSYDELGRVVTRGVDASTTNANNVGTTFDTLGRVTNVSNALGAFTYAYVDQTSRLSGVTYPSGTGLSTTYAYYNNVGDQRLQDITNAKGSTTLSKFDYTYNPVGTIATWEQQTDSNTPTQYALGYDQADQLKSAVQTDTSTSATVSSNGYNYDPAGNRLAETTLTSTLAGQFNNLNQLTSYSTVTGTQTVAGNTTANAAVNINAVPATMTNGTNFTANVPLPNGTNTVTVTANPSATGNSAATKRYQIVVSGTAPTQLTYDANGNTLTDENGNSYKWDALNRLTKITYPSGASSIFCYDGLSRRTKIIEKNSSGTVTSTKNYLWIGQEITEERDASNAVTKRFFPQGEQQAGTDYYYTWDHLGSVREMLNSSGTIVARYSYDPYGNNTLVSGSNLATFQYANLYQHQTSGLYLTEYRAFDPSTGRWLSRDPIQEMGGVNLYEYCQDDSDNRIDPSGLLSPNSSYCRALAQTIRNLQLKIWQRTLDIFNNPRSLPMTAPGDDKKPSTSVRGHQVLIEEDEANLARSIALYNGMCNDSDDPPGGTPACQKCQLVPVVVVQTVKGVTYTYIAYRCIRMIPSLYPPLWETIPANAEIP
jgi:RHS repeat-associated protein